MATSHDPRTIAAARLYPQSAKPQASADTREDRLPRQLGFWGTTALTVGLIVGTGIFRVPGAVATDAGSVAWYSHSCSAMAPPVRRLALPPRPSQPAQW